MRVVVAVVINVAGIVCGRILDDYIRVSPVSSAGSNQVFSNMETARICIAVAVISLILYPFYLRGFNKRKSRLELLSAISGFFIACQMLTALVVFYTALSPIDPNIHLIATIFAVVGGCAVALLRDFSLFRSVKNFPACFPAWLRTLSWIGLAGVLALSLAASAIAYKKNRNFAERVNVIQAMFAPTQTGFGYHDALEGIRYNQLIDFEYDEVTGTFYILERWGRIFSQRGSEQALIVDFRKVLGERPTDELGAYSILLNEKFLSNQKLFLYTTARGSVGNYNALIELDLNYGSSEEIWEKRRVVLKIATKSGSHNSGALAYGPDGFLHVGLGENGTSQEFPLPTERLNGSVLRIDPDKLGGDLSRPPSNKLVEGIERDYFIPVDNPFLDDALIADEIWSYGARNPFRIIWSDEMDGFITGDIGQWNWEELNIVRRGDNHGWPFFEAHDEYDEAPGKPTDRDDYAFPLYAYRHDARDRSIVGGPLYRGNRWPELKGKIIFGDNFSGKIWAMDPGAIPDDNSQLQLLVVAPNYNQNGLTKIHTTAQGEILFCVMGKWDGATGSVYRLTEEEQADPDSVNTPVKASASEIYATNCALCHGETGKGDGSVAKDAKLELADFTAAEWRATADSKYLHDIIMQGGLALGKNPIMPSWSEVLDEEQIEALVNYIESLGSEEPPTDPSPLSRNPVSLFSLYQIWPRV